MIWRVVVKRCRLSLRNGWFLAAWVVTVVLATLVVAVGWLDFQEREGLFTASRNGRVVRAEEANVYASVEIGLDRPPAVLGLISRGTGEELGSSATIRGRFGATELTRRSRSAAVLGDHSSGDLLYVLAQVLGFVCIFFAHGVVNGERLDGTLRQQLAYGLPRARLILGEFLGGWLTAAVPLVLVFAGFTLWTVVGGPQLAPDEPLRLLLLFGLVLLYSALWIAVALALSVTCRQTGTSLLLGLLFWVFTAVLYPSLAAWTAEKIAPLDPVLLARTDSASVQPSEDERVGAERLGANHGLRNDRSRQHRLYRNLASLLPVTALLDAGTLLATTSVDDHLRFLAEVDRAEQAMLRWQEEIVARYPDRVRSYSWGQPPLDLGSLPQPRYSPHSLGWSLRAAALPMSSLFFFLALGLVIAIVGIERMDVR